MKNILKLTGISVVAIMTANVANAAGYTCEELIEYTSCNPGYYFSVDNPCEDDYVLRTGFCYVDEYTASFDETAASCQEKYPGAKYYNSACVGDFEESNNYSRFYEITNGVTHCIQCPIGSICSGGTAGARPCPAGSYCAEVGLTQPSGKCNIGSYSGGGATTANCTACPATDLTDKDGATVVATTLTTGATTPSACVVGEEHYFTDAKGIYHFKSDCGLKLWHMTIETQAECESLGADWYWDNDSCFNDDAILTTTEEQCLSEIEDYGMEGAKEWVDGKCTCSSRWLIDSYGMFCY